MAATATDNDNTRFGELIMDTICDRLKVDDQPVCSDEVCKIVNETMIAPFTTDGPSGCESEDIDKALVEVSASQQLEAVKNFGARLLAYTKMLEQEASVTRNVDLLKLKQAEKLKELLAALAALIQKERKHVCAGQDCGPPVPGEKFLSFDQLAGAVREKREIRRGFLYPLRYPSLFQQKAKALLFYGPPGTGKSLLARATAKELRQAAFYAPTPASLKGRYIGDSEKAIKNVFDCACQRVEEDGKYNQAIIFFDEFESIATDRQREGTTSAQTVPTLLQMIDGVQARQEISIMAATNLPWILDPAIMRRFTSQILVDLPDRKSRLFKIQQKFSNQFEFLLDNTKKDDDYTSLEITLVEGGGLEKPYNKRNFGVKAVQTANGGWEIQGGIFWKDIWITVNRDYFGTEVDENLDEEIAAETGPRATDDAWTIRRFRRISEYDENAKCEYGMSLSDIDKVMDNAFRKMAGRALQGYAIKFPKRIYSDLHLAIIAFDNKWLHVDPDYVTEEEDKATLTKISKLSPADKTNVISYNLTKDDINQALAEFQCTLKDEDYEEMIAYYSNPATFEPGATLPTVQFGEGAIPDEGEAPKRGWFY
jgi:SpoVK/Ycf46/Vps4 family AAA+-type ATPase